ncbi:type I methionyl aminopeptidase [candidate division WOR-3 bacterium]|nr:type I methionyl aminopeptidase [candidate division WOR-3 bacterium]
MIIIKNKKEIECIKRASDILVETFYHINDMITPGVKTRELDEEIEKVIRQKGAIPAFKGYRGFPASSCISINEVVIHGIPDDMKLCSGDIVGIDIGVKYNGCFSDAAYTFGVGEISGEAERLLNTTKKALFASIEEARSGNRIGDISHTIQQTAESAGYNVVREYVGHGVGLQLHEDPAIPNYGRKGVGPRLKKGMVLAIEPMINMGTHRLTVMDDGWTVVTEDKRLSAHYEHTIAITDNGAEILTLSDLYKD